MKFEKTIILEWYDNIITAFVRADDGDYYYCALLYQYPTGNNKIYACVKLDFFEQPGKIYDIIHSGEIKSNWKTLEKLLNSLEPDSKGYLIKSEDLIDSQLIIVHYPKDLSSLNGILFSDYPEIIQNASKVDNWSEFFAM